MAMEHLARLKTRLGEIDDLQRAAQVLSWDQSTYMPARGGAGRARQLATLGSLAHRLLTEPEVARMLAEAEAEVEAEGLPSDHADVVLLRVARHDRERAVRVPRALMEEIALATALAYDTWVAARSSDDFAAFAPHLQKNIDLTLRKTEHLGYDRHPYDALLEDNEPGMTTERLRSLFDDLRAGVTPLLEAIVAHADQVDDSVLYREYDEQAQLRFSEDVVRRFGYDFSRGRLDLTVHPFATSFGHGDVRITTRVSPTFLQMALMGTMHEAGHGLYEQNFAPELARTPLAHGSSGGVHESQSRLWENVVGRRRDVWDYLFPLAQQAFPEQLGDAEAETLYRAFNKVTPSLIRVEADEVTYNLHTMLRFELENDLLEGRLAVADLPEAWNAAMQRHLGVTPSTNTEGVLQDVHWSIGYFAGFPSYTVGNVLSVQFYDAAARAIPSIPGDLAAGRFDTLLNWLRENVYRHGRTYQPDALAERVTGSPITAEPYLRYLREKYGALYGVEAASAPPLPRQGEGGEGRA